MHLAIRMEGRSIRLRFWDKMEEEEKKDEVFPQKVDKIWKLITDNISRQVFNGSETCRSFRMCMYAFAKWSIDLMGFELFDYVYKRFLTVKNGGE